MTIDTQKIDDAVLALLYLTSFEQYGGVRAWKGHNWDALNRLYEKGMISDPRRKTKSIVFSDEGAERAKLLFGKLFGK
jgi:hypothetical protein